jgi:glycosyltransferase involved in cell wall biosynthesis
VSRTRVLWLTKGLGLGGAERLLALTAAKLDAQRFDVEVAYVLPWKRALVPELERHIAVRCLDGDSTLDPRWVLRLRRLLRQRRFDIVHTHSPVPAAAARLLAGSATRLIHTEHNVWDRYRWPTYAANAATYGRNDAVIAVSDGVTASIRRPRWVTTSYPTVETLLHGVDPEGAPRGAKAREAARTLLGIAESTPVIATVANFTPKKNHDGLLQALKIIRGTVPDIVYVLIGSGPLEADLRASVEAGGLRDHVRFLGSRDDVTDLLPAFDVFVLGSQYEGLPISMLEAMAAEVACVVTRVGGIPEVIEDRVEGWLVPAGEPEALAGAVTRVLGDATLRAEMAAAGRNRAATAFSIDRAVRRTEAIYSGLLAPAVVDG